MAKMATPNDGAGNYTDCVPEVEILHDKNGAHLKDFQKFIFRYGTYTAARCPSS